MGLSVILSHPTIDDRYESLHIPGRERSWYVPVLGNDGLKRLHGMSGADSEPLLRYALELYDAEPIGDDLPPFDTQYFMNSSAFEGVRKPIRVLQELHRWARQCPDYVWHVW